MHPIYAQKRSQEVFQPLVSYLEKETGHQITLQTPRSFLSFWNTLRTPEQYNLVLLEPHLMDYGIQKLNLTPLAKSSDPTQYSLIVSDEFADLDPTEALVGKKIAVLPAPSLGNVLLEFIFPNPIQQPRIDTTAPSWRDDIESIFAGEVDAAMVPTWLAERFPNLTPVLDSNPLPGFAVAKTQQTSVEVGNAIKNALIKLGENKSEQELEVLFELKTKKFEPAYDADFQGLSQFLVNVFGY